MATDLSRHRPGRNVRPQHQSGGVSFGVFGSSCAPAPLGQ